MNQPNLSLAPDYWREGCAAVKAEAALYTGRSATKDAVEDAMVTGIRAACDESMSGSVPLIAFSAAAFAGGISIAEYFKEFAAGASHTDLIHEIDAVVRHAGVAPQTQPEPVAVTEDCAYCNGSGEVMRDSGPFPEYARCSNCRGTGRVKPTAANPNE